PGSQTLVPGHSPLPQCGREKFAPDGSADPMEVEDSIDVVDVLVRVRLSVVSSELGRLLESCRNGAPHNLLREGAARVFLVATRWRMVRRRVAVQRCWTLMPLVSSTFARRRPLFSHEDQPL
ncbi:hypothetical protein A2U01_0059111, partial [Trifolium medium]|nr:hypothetical protein [Trifolium medium]